MQLFLLAAAPTIAQLSSIALCGCILGRVHYKMVVERAPLSVNNFSSVIIACASIQIVFKVIDNIHLTPILKLMPIVMCH